MKDTVPRQGLTAKTPLHYKHWPTHIMERCDMYR